MPQFPAPPAARTNCGWLSTAEQHAFDWLTPRVPQSLTPDGLTTVGLAAGIVVLTGYLLTAHPSERRRAYRYRFLLD